MTSNNKIGDGRKSIRNCLPRPPWLDPLAADSAVGALRPQRRPGCPIRTSPCQLCSPGRRWFLQEGPAWADAGGETSLNGLQCRPDIWLQPEGDRKGDSHEADITNIAQPCGEGVGLGFHVAARGGGEEVRAAIRHGHPQR